MKTQIKGIRKERYNSLLSDESPENYGHKEDEDEEHLGDNFLLNFSKNELKSDNICDIKYVISNKII